MNDGPSPSAFTYGLIEGSPDFTPKAAYFAYSRFIEDAVADDAELLSSDLPRAFRQGETARATVTFRNTGTTTWNTQALIALAAEIDSQSWSITAEQLAADESVGPGESREFELVITPPPAKEIGSDPVLSVRMERQTSWPFGDLLRRVVVLTQVAPPEIVSGPDSVVLERGGSARLTVEAVGPGPLGYRWLRNGLTLVDDDQWSGSSSAELTVTALSFDVEAFYQCIVSNQAGEVASAAAEVSIGHPAPRRGGGRVTPDPGNRIPQEVLDGIRFSGPPGRR
jgi:hypothetical protein